MIKNVEQIYSAPFGFMMPLGVSSNSHKVYFNNPFIIMQNEQGTIYQFEDDSFNLDTSEVFKKKIDEWVNEIHSKTDTSF